MKRKHKGGNKKGDKLQMPHPKRTVIYLDGSGLFANDYAKELRDHGFDVFMPIGRNRAIEELLRLVLCDILIVLPMSIGTVQEQGAKIGFALASGLRVIGIGTAATNFPSLFHDRFANWQVFAADHFWILGSGYVKKSAAVVKQRIDRRRL